jgi:hypothetical protein
LQSLQTAISSISPSNSWAAEELMASDSEIVQFGAALAASWLNDSTLTASTTSWYYQQGSLWITVYLPNGGGQSIVLTKINGEWYQTGDLYPL